jgi:pimeloyl-ACP methyl ester carboxylesterase
MMIDDVRVFFGESSATEHLAFDLERIRRIHAPCSIYARRSDGAPVPADHHQTRGGAAIRGSGNIAGAGHVVQVEKPEDYAEAMTAFVRRQAGTHAA